MQAETDHRNESGTHERPSKKSRYIGAAILGAIIFLGAFIPEPYRPNTYVVIVLAVAISYISVLIINRVQNR